MATSPYTYKDGKLYAADGTPIESDAEIDLYMPESTDLSFLTPGDIERQQKAALTEYGVNAGVGAGLGAAQLGLSFIDTPSDTYSKAELAKLEKLEKAGKLGLTGAERQYAESTLMNPVRAMAADTARRTEQRLAASGRGSAADVVRAGREEQKAVSDASIGASQRIVQAHFDKAAAQRLEAEQRRATESGRERERISMVGKTIAGLAANFGKVAAGMAVAAEPTDQQLLQMQGAEDAAGKPLFPGIQRMSLEEMRGLYKKDAAGAWLNPEAFQTAQSGNIPASGG